MANGNHNTKLGRLIFVLISIACMLNNESVEGGTVVSMRSTELVKHKGTVKTIKSEDGDVIDCVDIYKQPAFDHPLLKTHKIPMKPTSYPSGIMPLNSKAKIFQSWLKNGQCPERTVPIRRTRKNDYHQAIQLSQRRTSFHHNFAAGSHEYAQVSAIDRIKYYGAHASINVWNPTTENGEFSVAQIWLLSGSEGNLNTIEAGWMVYPELYHNNQTRFFVYWTRDNYQGTGCYNLDCPGFVQTSQKFVVGTTIKPVSGYNGQQYDIVITIQKEGGNWWLHVQDEIIGYWPSSIFSSLSNSASIISWGGEIVNKNPGGHHTSTQMGSGHFPREGYGKSSYFRNLGVMDEPKNLIDPGTLKPYVSNPTSYDLHVEENRTTDYGTYFFYGGPGY